MYADFLKGWGGGGVRPGLEYQTHTKTIHCEFDIVYSATWSPLEVNCEVTFMNSVNS